jgi:hypothetical protein
MAVSLNFKGSESSETNDTVLELFANTKKELYIKIETNETLSYICLDVDDAKKLSKELKKQINIITNDK